MEPKYPDFNDREYDLLKKTTRNTAIIADNGGGGGGGVTSIIAGTNISIDQSTGDVTISATGGGGGTPGGSNGDLQYNNAGSFGGYTPGTGVIAFLQSPTSANLAAALTDETGTGSAVFGTSPTIASPNLTGTTTVATANATNLAATNFTFNSVSVTGPTGTGNMVLATSPTLTTPNLGTPSAATLTNATGLPISTGVSGLGTGVATFLATPSSANLAAAVTNETGSGALVFATSPTLVTPVLGTPTSGTLSNCTVDGTTSVGFLSVPSNSQSAAYTLVLADSGKAIDHPASDANARTFTIPANGTVAFPVGTVISFSNMTSQVVTIAITTDTLYLAGTGSTGSRSLAQYGVATARKITSTAWLIAGTGLT